MRHYVESRNCKTYGKLGSQHYIPVLPYFAMHRAVANFRKNIWFPETLWNMSNLCWKKHKRLLLQSSLHYVLYRILYYFRLGSPVSYEILQYCTLYSVHSDPACPQKVISVERIRIRFPVWCRFKHACRILLLIDAIHMLLVAMLDYPWRMDDTVFERFLSSVYFGQTQPTTTEKYSQTSYDINPRFCCTYFLIVCVYWRVLYGAR